MKMKLALLLSLLTVASCASVTPVSTEPDPFERIYAALGIDRILTELDERTGPTIQREAEQSEEKNGTPLTPGEKQRLALSIRIALEQRGGIDHAAAKKVFHESLLTRLSDSDMAVAAAFYSTPTGKRIHVAVVEAEKAINEHLEEIDASLPPVQMELPNRK